MHKLGEDPQQHVQAKGEGMEDISAIPPAEAKEVLVLWVDFHMVEAILEINHEQEVAWMEKSHQVVE